MARTVSSKSRIAPRRIAGRLLDADAENAQPQERASPVTSPIRPVTLLLPRSTAATSRCTGNAHADPFARRRAIAVARVDFPPGDAALAAGSCAPPSPRAAHRHPPRGAGGSGASRRRGPRRRDRDGRIRRCHTQQDRSASGVPAGRADTESRPAIGSEAGARAGSNGSTRPRESTSASRSVSGTSATGVASRSVTRSVPGSRRSTVAPQHTGNRRRRPANRLEPIEGAGVARGGQGGARRRTHRDTARQRPRPAGPGRTPAGGPESRNAIAAPTSTTPIAMHRDRAVDCSSSSGRQQRADRGADAGHVAGAEGEEHVAVAQQAATVAASSARSGSYMHDGARGRQPRRQPACR